MRRIGHGWLLALVLAAVGCRAPEPPAYPTWATDPVPYTPSPESGNAFDGYVLAAQQADEATARYRDRVSFTPGQRDAMIAACGPAVTTLRRSSRLPMDFRFSPTRPFTAPPHQRGWRALGRVLTWRVGMACAQGSYDAAIEDFLLATRFGFDLTGGGATDADLGLTIVNDARRALAPSLPAMGAGQLARLAQGVESAARRRPPMERMLTNERQNMLLAVQAVQDAYRDESLAEFAKRLGPEARDAVVYLNDLRGKDPAERVAYFQGFAEEVDLELAWLRQRLELSVRDREAESAPAYRELRPWRRFSRHFFRAPRPLLETNDATRARTRLLVLEAELLRRTKASGRAPARVPTDLVRWNVDPFTGRPFVYRAEGKQFLIYSVGSDLKDDGGATDETFSAPDLRLERNPD